MRRFSVFVIGIFLFSYSYSQDSLTIEQAIQYAVKHNYGVLISRNSIEIGKINNSWANAGALPVVSGTLSKSLGINNIDQKLNSGTDIKKNGATNQNLQAGLNVNYNVLNGFKLFATKKRLEELERNGEYAFKQSLNQIIYNVVTGYFNIVKLKEQQKATEEQIQLYQDRLKIADVKYQIGSGAKYEYLQAQIDLNEQISSLLTIKNQIDVAKNDLNTLLGKPADTLYKVADTIMINPIPDLITVTSKIDKQNADILLANSNLEILRQSRKEINAGRLPTIIVNGNYNFVRSANGAGLTLYNQTYGPSASIGLSVPIFNGGVVNRQLRINDIQLKNQNLSIDQARLNANNMAQDAFANYNNALAIVELEKNNLKLNAENVFIATQRFKELNITSVELRTVQLSYINSETRLYNALYQAKVAETELALLTGDISTL